MDSFSDTQSYGIINNRVNVYKTELFLERCLINCFHKEMKRKYIVKYLGAHKDAMKNDYYLSK